MGNINYSKTFKDHWEVIALIAGVGIVLSLLFSIIQPFQYEASTRLLIIQKQVGNLDAYTATKSAEKIGKNLTSILYTSSFYNNVIESNPTIAALFSTDANKRRKEWEHNIEADVIPETGIIEIGAFDEDKAIASQIVRSIAYTLVNQGSQYHGGGAGVEIKVVDDVLVSNFPKRPNIVLNIIAAAIIGIIVGSVFVIFQEIRKLKRQQSFDFSDSDEQGVVFGQNKPIVTSVVETPQIQQNTQNVTGKKYWEV